MTSTVTARDRARSGNEPPVRGVLEEVGNAVSHGVGSLMGIAGLVLLLLRSNTPEKRLGALMYGLSLLIMFLMSCLYHAFRTGSGVKRLWRRFDYSAIYLLIGGTFAPILTVWLGGRLGLVLLCLQWAVILTGTTLIAVFGPGRFTVLHRALYVLLGWSALCFLPTMTRTDPALFGMILSGGILYTLGLIPFAARRRGAHFIWHLFVLFGAMLHWFAIYLFLYR